jgi:para-aminobenzoate synthetase
LRTLLIDNYDSYTYNLYQLLAQVNGTEPDVVTNDIEVSALALTDYDAIVISPGPGHPGHPRDFGVCAHVLTTATIPVLGVCLGHQGLALSEGGRVVPAPAPRHGHVSRIRHNDDLLFDGIPTEFAAVRYHSLAVAEPLPVQLAAIAWSEDNVVMALRHRGLPRWGVQFHPESIESEHGLALLRNFRDMSSAHHRSTPPIATPTRRASVSADPPLRYRAHVRRLSEAVDTEAAFVRLHGDSTEAFWLDSSRVEEGLSRFSFLGDCAGPLSEVIRYRVGDQPDIFEKLRKELARRTINAPEVPFDFTGGYVGYFGYELKADSLRTPNSHVAQYPDATWLFADRFVAVDHLEQHTYLVALSIDAPTEIAAAQWLDATAATLAALPSPPELPTVTANLDIAPWLTRDRHDYLRDVELCKQRLRAGESYEINLTTAAVIPATEPGLTTYRRLRRLNPAPYAAYLRTPDVEVACSSPERFLRIDTDRGVETKPIKGTIPRGRTAAADELQRLALADDRKTRAENLMIVDLLRNDLGRVCTVGSVRVPVLMAVESYQTLHHLVSTVRGELRADLDAIDCVRACFPGGSMTGAPKLRTCEIIDKIEDGPRGVYSGTIGLLGCNGTVDLNVVIRTMVLVNQQWHIGAGGAIVLDSDAAAEYDEMLLKAAAPIRALPVPTPIPS